MTAPRILTPVSPLSLDEDTEGQAKLSVDLSSKANASHTHAQSDVTGLSDALADKVDDDDSRLTDARTPTAHAASHGSGQSDAITVAQSQVTGLTDALNAKAAASHTHEVDDIDATGTPSSSTYLRGDGAWATPSGGGGGTPDAHAASHASGGDDPVTLAQSQITDLVSDLGGKVDDDDSRLSDARTPTAHAASHGEGQSDAITVAQSQVSGLATALSGKSDTSHTHDDRYYTENEIDEALTDYVETDDARLSDARTPTSHAASHGSGQSDAITIAQSQVTDLVTDLGNKAAANHDHDDRYYTETEIGTILEGFVESNDSRLSDARTPTTHAASHGVGQADAITVAQSQVTDLTTDLGNKANISHAHATSDVTGLDALLASFVAHNVHDGEEYPARPTAAVVMWIGPDDPDTDAEANDIWLDTDA